MCFYIYVTFKNDKTLYVYSNVPEILFHDNKLYISDYKNQPFFECHVVNLKETSSIKIRKMADDYPHSKEEYEKYVEWLKQNT